MFLNWTEAEEYQSLNKTKKDFQASYCEPQLETDCSLADQPAEHMFFADFSLSFLRNLKKAEEKVKSLEDEIAENKTKSESLMKLFKDLEEQATAVLEAHQQAQV